MNIDDLITEYEKDPATKKAIEQGREYVKNRIEREGYDWIYEMFVCVPDKFKFHKFGLIDK